MDGPGLHFLGLTVGCIVHGLTDDERKEAYGCDVTYGTNNEFGFDYLRDNMKYSMATMTQRGHHYAIVDEVDSILIDEARTPLIISGPDRRPDRSLSRRRQADPDLLEADDYELDEKQRTVTLTEAGNEHIVEALRAAELLETGDLYDIENITLLHHVNQALKAHKLFLQGPRLHREERRSRHHRRVHGPHDAGAALFGRPAPGA